MANACCILTMSTGERERATWILNHYNQIYLIYLNYKGDGSCILMRVHGCFRLSGEVDK
jgi:hypothetical protein